MPSSVIAKMEYARETETLRIIYRSGAVYDYFKIPPEIFNEMKNSFSKGVFLNNRIKPLYDFEKIK